MALAVVLPAWAGPAAGQADDPGEPPRYTIHRVEDAGIRVDGLLDEPAWTDATVIERFWEWTPGQNVEPPVETRFLLLLDDHALHVAAVAGDPEPDRIRAHLLDRDAILSLIQDDYVMVMLDTFGDHRRAFQFRVNPLGVQADALNGFDSGLEDWSWDLLWESAGRLTDDGYVVELSLPLDQLPFPAAEAGTEAAWRINLSRSWPRDQRHRWASHPTRYGDACASCSYSIVSGFDGLEPGQALEIVPTVTALADESRPALGEDFADAEEDAEVGVSGRWNVTQGTRVSFAVNPDFSQVEADAAQLAVNQRFALFFPEQRPFFLEDVDLFNTPIRAVFTRTVADPAWGLKLTSKKGSNAFGVFASQDELNNVLLPGNQGSRFASSADGVLDEDVLGAVLRYRRDFGQRNSIGLLYTGREADDYANHVVGIDGSIRLAAADTLRFQLMSSDTTYPDSLVDAYRLDDAAPTGEAFRLEYGHFDRNWNWSANLQRIDEGFRADSGFVSRVDTQGASGRIERVFWPTDAFLTNWSVSANGYRTENTDGVLTDSKIGLALAATGPRQSRIFGQTWIIEKRDGPALFDDLTGAEILFEIQPTGVVRLELYAAWEDEVDFTNHREADLLQLAPSLSLRLGRRVQTSLQLFRRAFSNGEGTYLRADLAELRFWYHFNNRSFVRAIVQRLAQTNDPDQFVVPVRREIEDVFTQLLFSYKVNAQTVLFAGYSDSRVADDVFSLTQTERSLFLKIGYAFTL